MLVTHFAHPAFRVLIVGASGFIGSAVAKQMLSQGVQASYLARRGSALAGRPNAVPGDLTDLPSLISACQGHQTIVNAASFVGSDPSKQHQVNAVGGSNLAIAADRAGASRVVYISSTSVYGGAVSNGAREKLDKLTPRSTLNTSRLVAERATIDVGGIVLRPHLVYGPGDRFFIPPLLRAMRALGGWIEGGRARVSIISSESLARVISEVSTDLSANVGGRVFHAAHPETVTVAQLVERVTQPHSMRLPSASYGTEYTLRALRKMGVSQSQIEMVAKDNWLDSGSLWGLLATSPGTPIDISPAGAAWYESSVVAMPLYGVPHEAKISALARD